MRTTYQTNLGGEFVAVDPSTGEPIRTYRDASPREIATAAQAAQRASLDRRLLDDERRAAFLGAAAAGLRERNTEIVARAALETGLPHTRLDGELERTTRQLEAFASLVAGGDYLDACIDPLDANARPIPRPDVRRMLVPLGPVAVFGASNFPLAFSTAGGDTASALAAGCPVIVKGHPAHPGTGEIVAEVLAMASRQMGMPEGTFSHLTSAGPAVGQLLVERPEIRAVAFTGSFAAGRALWQRATARPLPIPVYAEMSSVNPLVITTGALHARSLEIAEGLAGSISGSAGQLCTKPGLIFVSAGTRGSQLQVDVARRLTQIGPQVLLTERIADALLARVRELEDLAEPLGGDAQVHQDEPGFRARPRIFRTTAERLRSNAGLREECFGPVALFVEYEDLDQLLSTLCALDGQLTATLHAERDEVETSLAIARVLQGIAGRLIFNGYPTSVSVTHAMHHGGPYPATTDPAHTSVGTAAIARFLRPVAWQNAPAELLPPELRDDNPRGIARRVDGRAWPRP
jgi:alpha-ketoglutaric semialdehyde dehydrogenase